MITIGEIVLINELNCPTLAVSAVARKLVVNRKTSRRHLTSAL